MKCEHQIKSYDKWKDSKKVDGIEVLWQCDGCEQKGSHHFEFNKEESIGRDEDVWNKLVSEIEKNPKPTIGMTKRELKALFKDGKYENLEDYILQEWVWFCEHSDFYDDSKEDITIEYDTHHYTQTCGNCGYIRDCIYGRQEESK